MDEGGQTRHTEVNACPTSLRPQAWRATWPTLSFHTTIRRGVMVLDADVLSVVLRFVDTLDKTPRTASTTTTAVVALHGNDNTAVHAVRGGAECRRVNRAWRSLIEDVIGRALPPMASVSLAPLLAPGRLRFVLLACRYDDHHDDHGVVSAYDALVSRAEAVSLRLREAASPRETAAGARALLAANDSGVAGAVVSGARENAPCRANNSGSNSEMNVGTSGGNRNCLCYRVALKRIVGEALRSPSFSWCSTLGPDDSRLLEGCVGASSLLEARWFSG